MITNRDIEKIQAKIGEIVMIRSILIEIKQKMTTKSELQELMNKLNMIYEEVKATREIMKRTNSLRSR